MDANQTEIKIERGISYREFLPYKEEILERCRQEEALGEYVQSGRAPLTWGWYFEFLASGQGVFRVLLPEESMPPKERIVEIIGEVFEAHTEDRAFAETEVFRQAAQAIIYFCFGRTNQYGRDEEKKWRMVEKLCSYNRPLAEFFFRNPFLKNRMSMEDLKLKVSFELIEIMLSVWNEQGNRQEEIAEVIGKLDRALDSAMLDLHFPEIVTFLARLTEGKRELRRAYARFLMRVEVSAGWSDGAGQNCWWQNETSQIANMLKAAEMAANAKHDYNHDERNHLFWLRELQALCKEGIDLFELYLMESTAFKSPRIRLAVLEKLFLLQGGRGKVTMALVEEFVWASNYPVVDEKLQYKRPKPHTADEEKTQAILWIFSKLEISALDSKSDSKQDKMYGVQLLLLYIATEEQLQFFYRKGIFPKKILKRLVDFARQARLLGRIPLLLQWFYETED